MLSHLDDLPACFSLFPSRPIQCFTTVKAICYTSICSISRLQNRWKRAEAAYPERKGEHDYDPLVRVYRLIFQTRTLIEMLLEWKNRMRTMHDSILIGIGTALNDDPQLNSESCLRTTYGQNLIVSKLVISLNENQIPQTVIIIHITFPGRSSSTRTCAFLHIANC